MSYTTINQSVNDVELRDRIRSAIAKEAWANESYGGTSTGQLVRDAGPDAVLGEFMWPCCIDFEADYSYAVDQGNEHPGGDPGVIGDDEIQSAVQVHWPTPPVEPSNDVTLSTLMPSSAAVGAANVELHAFGTNFGDDAVLVFDGADQDTTVNSAGDVSATVDMPSAPGTVLVLVRSGNSQSDPLPFIVG